MTQHEPKRVAAVAFVALAALCHVPVPDARAQGGAARAAQSRAASRRKPARPREENEQARAHVEEGLRRAEEGQWAEAFRAYNQALALSPRFADAYVAMGDAYMSTGKYAEAFKAYREAVGVAPWSADAHYSLGAAYNDMAQYGDAFKPFVQAVRLDPEFAEAHYGIGYAYLKLENFKDALPYLRQAVRLRPDYAEAHLALGQTYLGLRDVRAAEAQLKTLAGLDAAAARELEGQVREAGSAASLPARPATAGGRERDSDPQARLFAEYKPGRTLNSRPAPPQKPAKSPAVPADQAPALAVELSFWESIKNSGDPEEFAAYLRKYPEGQFAELARIRARALGGRKAEASNAEDEPKPQAADSPTPSAAQQPAEGVAAQPPKEQPAGETPATEQPPEERPAPNVPERQAAPATPEAALDLLRRLLPSKFSYRATTSGGASGDAPVTSEVNINYEPLKFEGCTVEWRDQNDALWVSLSDLDPEAVRVEARSRPGTTFSAEVWNVSISAAGGKGAINEAKGDGSGAVNRYNGLDLQYDSREKAERLAAAFRQAIRLCVAKP